MERMQSNRSTSRQSGSGLPVVLLALLLVAIAAAIDVAWMTPGKAVPEARNEYAAAAEHSTAAVDAMVAAHHGDKARAAAGHSAAN